MEAPARRRQEPHLPRRPPVRLQHPGVRDASTRSAEKKWESTRGVGHSFGANRNERPEDIVTATELIRSFCDIVAKNGNLLIGIGPNERGVILEEQIRPLRGLGQWLAGNGDAVFGTRPWDTAATITTEGTDVRFTRRGDTTYALLSDLPGSRTFGLRGVKPGPGTKATLLVDDVPLDVGDRDGMLELTMPDRIPVQAAYAVRLQDVFLDRLNPTSRPASRDSALRDLDVARGAAHRAVALPLSLRRGFGCLEEVCVVQEPVHAERSGGLVVVRGEHQPRGDRADRHMTPEMVKAIGKLPPSPSQPPRIGKMIPPAP